jgi:hypothetical protein
MRILFDHSAPAPLIRFLEGHDITTAKRAGWERLVDGQLLDAAEQAGFEVLLTSDKRISSQQNLSGRAIALVVLGNPNWNIVRRYVRRISSAVNSSKPGNYTEVEIPFR